jgi:hypothetical protein
MPKAKTNRNVSENRAITQKIDELRMQGIRKDRATAAAFRMFSDGELTIKIANIKSSESKTKQQIKIQKAVIAAVTALRQKTLQQKRRLARAEILARRARIEAKKSGKPESLQEQQKRLRTEPIARTIDSLRRRQI